MPERGGDKAGAALSNEAHEEFQRRTRVARIVASKGTCLQLTRAGGGDARQLFETAQREAPPR